MKIVEERENLLKRKTREKRRGKLISQNSVTHLFNIQMTKFISSGISMKYWKSQILEEKKSGYAFKITHIAAARCPKLPNSALN